MSEHTVPIGTPVQYFLDATSEPTAAIATAKGAQGRLEVAIFVPKMHNHDVKDGVPHISDAPNWTHELVGFWDYLPQDRPVEKRGPGRPRKEPAEVM